MLQQDSLPMSKRQKIGEDTIIALDFQEYWEARWECEKEFKKKVFARLPDNPSCEMFSRTCDEIKPEFEVMFQKKKVMCKACSNIMCKCDYSEEMFATREISLAMMLQ